MMTSDYQKRPIQKQIQMVVPFTLEFLRPGEFTKTLNLAFYPKIGSYIEKGVPLTAQRQRAGPPRHGAPTVPRKKEIPCSQLKGSHAYQA
jgi:hypothetical protein